MNAVKHARHVLYALLSTHGGRKIRPGGSSGTAGSSSGLPANGAPAGRAAAYIVAVGAMVTGISSVRLSVAGSVSTARTP